MPWIHKIQINPLEEGEYKCLIEIDEMGTLQESRSEKFDGQDWSHFESSRQYIRYWWANKKTYEKLSAQYERDFHDYCAKFGNKQAGLIIEQ